MNLSVITLLPTHPDFEGLVRYHRLWRHSLTPDCLTVFHDLVCAAYDATDPGKGRLVTMRGKLHAKIEKPWH
jgi:hypothetical protein